MLESNISLKSLWMADPMERLGCGRCATLNLRVEDIENGCGFNLSRFLESQDPTGQINEVLSIIDTRNIVEFDELVKAVREENANLLELLVSKTFFFSKYIDSKRYGIASLKGER